MPTKSWKKHPQKLLRKSQIHSFFLTAWAGHRAKKNNSWSKMWLIDPLYVELVGISFSNQIVPLLTTQIQLAYCTMLIFLNFTTEKKCSATRNGNQTWTNFINAKFYEGIAVHTVRPRDTRPQAARTLQVHIFELGPKIFELNEFL